MGSKKVVGFSGLGIALFLGAQGAAAQVALQPQAIPFGSFVLTPTLNATTVFDDNIYNTHSKEVSSFSQVLSPTLTFLAQDRVNVYKATYVMNAGSFANDSNDSYADHIFDLNAHIEPDGRLRFDSGLAYSMLHDARGTGSTAGFALDDIRAIGEVDKYDVFSVRVGGEYGAQDARGLVVANAMWDQKRYDRKFVALGRDNDSLNTLLGLRARVMPKTTFLVDYERSKTDYDTAHNKGGGADSLDNRVLVGVTWENTVQTTGRLRVGHSKRKIEDQDDISSGTWDLGVTWAPMPLDSFVINAGSRVTDATAPFTSVKSKSYSVSWAHDWLDRFNTALSWANAKNNYQGGPTSRRDTDKTYALSANYQMRRWLVLSAGVNVNDRGSNVNSFDTKRNVMSVGAQISL